MSASAWADVAINASSLSSTRLLAVKSVSDVLRITAGPLNPVLSEKTWPVEWNSTTALLSDGIVTAST